MKKNEESRTEKSSPYFFSVAPSVCRGFTLIELIIVLLIIGISLGLVGIFVSQGTSKIELKRFAKETATTLRYARNRAVSEKKRYSFIVRDNGTTYDLYKADNTENIEDDMPRSVISRPIPEKLKLKFSEKGEGVIKIEFFPGGSSSGGVIDIRDHSGRSLSVTVNRVTGKVEIGKVLNSQ